MAVRHHAFGFDGEKYLAAVARAVGPGPRFRWRDLAAEARRVTESANPETRAVLAYLRFDEDWLDTGSEFSASRLLAVVLAEQLEALPSLSSPGQHDWWVLERIASIAGWNRSDVDRLVRGAPLASLPVALGRPDLIPVFQDSREPGGVLPAPSVGPMAIALASLEHRFRCPGQQDAAALGDSLPAVKTGPGLAHVTSGAFDNALAMLRAAKGQSIFLLFE